MLKKILKNKKNKFFENGDFKKKKKKNVFLEISATFAQNIWKTCPNMYLDLKLSGPQNELKWTKLTHGNNATWATEVPCFDDY